MIERGTGRRSGTDSVTLLAPDQVVITMANPGLNLVSLAHRFFRAMAIVISEGFQEDLAGKRFLIIY